MIHSGDKYRASDIHSDGYDPNARDCRPLEDRENPRQQESEGVVVEAFVTDGTASCSLALGGYEIVVPCQLLMNLGLDGTYRLTRIQDKEERCDECGKIITGKNNLCGTCCINDKWGDQT